VSARPRGALSLTSDASRKHGSLTDRCVEDRGRGEEEDAHPNERRNGGAERVGTREERTDGASSWNCAVDDATDPIARAVLLLLLPWSANPDEHLMRSA